MKRTCLVLISCILMFASCKKKDTPAPDNGNTVKPADTADRYTGVSRTYKDMGYIHLGRFESENAYRRTYTLTCEDINITGGRPEMVALQFWSGNAAATIPVYGSFQNDSFFRVSSYTGCYKQFGVTNPLYTYNYKIGAQGLVYNWYTRANLTIANTYDLFVCDNSGLPEGKGLYSPAKPKVLLQGGDYYAYSVGESVISLGNPLIVSKLNKSSNEWNSMDTIDYLPGFNTSIDAIAGPSGTIYVCVNPMPTDNTTGRLRVYKSTAAGWIKTESSSIRNMADSITALGKTVACNLRLIANGEQPFIAVMRDNSLLHSVTFCAYDGNQITVYNPVECNVSDGILPGSLHYVYHDNQILTNGINMSYDYARTIYKVTANSGFVPYKNIPASVNRKIERLHSQDGKLYIAIKEIWGPEFSADADRHLEFMDLLQQQ